MTEWINRQKRAAANDLAPNDELLDRIEEWQERAAAVADEHAQNQTKRAVQECPPGDVAAGALFGLFARHAETIWHVCNEQMERASEVEALTLEDVLMEAYPLYIRAMVRYDPARGPLDLYLASALSRRVQIYIASHAHESAEEGAETEVEDAETIAPGYNIPELYEELIAEGAVPERAAEVYDRLHPDR